MKILITGASGFVGKNLINELQNKGYKDLMIYSHSMELGKLEDYCRECGFVFHLAGVNRPKFEFEFEQGNVEFTKKLLYFLKKYSNNSAIVYASSIQAKFDSPYGKSKKKAEDAIIEHGRENCSSTLIYRFPNIFGKWCKPNYNSAIATFCHNIANDLPINVNNENTELNLVYIDDVIKGLLNSLSIQDKLFNNFAQITPIYSRRLEDIAKIIKSFADSRKNLLLPEQSDALTKKLYSTYLSYLPKEKFKYPLFSHSDYRGSFTEFIKTEYNGQVSINISKPHIIKGNHWHNSKHEKFLVVSGNGIIRFRKPGHNEIVEFYVSGEKLEVIDIPPGYIHNIENIGENDLVTVMWANEIFDPNFSDTYAGNI